MAAAPGAGVAGRGAVAGQVGLDGPELATGSRGERRGDALVELRGVEPPGGGVLAEAADRLVPLGVRGSQRLQVVIHGSDYTVYIGPMQAPLRLTPTSYVVLGLVNLAGATTPYEMKQAAAASVGNFWTLQHAQFYTEPQRLTEAGLLEEEREAGGRRRRVYRLTGAGRSALEEWRREPTDDLGELREPALLKLFFGAPPAKLATAQLAAHRAKLAAYEDLREQLDASGGPPGPRATLEAGIAHEREWVRFWSERAGEPASGD